jgi:predicted Zn-dependent protease
MQKPAISFHFWPGIEQLSQQLNPIFRMVRRLAVRFALIYQVLCCHPFSYSWTNRVDARKYLKMHGLGGEGAYVSFLASGNNRALAFSHTRVVRFAHFLTGFFVT